MAEKKSFQNIKNEIEEAEHLVKVGGVYAHYKNPLNTYKVIGFATQEATDTLAVIYQPLYDSTDLLFVRDLKNWLEKADVDGKKVERFRLIEELL